MGNVVEMSKWYSVSVMAIDDGGGDVVAGNVVTVVFIPIALIASMVGIASTLAGTHHLRIWRTESLAAAAAASLIAWLLTLLAMGLAAKEIHTHYGRSKRLVSIPKPYSLNPYTPRILQ